MQELVTQYDKALCGNIFTPQREATLYIEAAIHQRRLDRYSVTDVATSQLANALGAGCGNAASPDLRGGALGIHNQRLYPDNEVVSPRERSS